MKETLFELQTTFTSQPTELKLESSFTFTSVRSLCFGQDVNYRVTRYASKSSSRFSVGCLCSCMFQEFSFSVQIDCKNFANCLCNIAKFIEFANESKYQIARFIDILLCPTEGTIINLLTRSWLSEKVSGERKVLFLFVFSLNFRPSSDKRIYSFVFAWWVFNLYSAVKCH